REMVSRSSDAVKLAPLALPVRTAKNKRTTAEIVLNPFLLTRDCKNYFQMINVSDAIEKTLSQEKCSVLAHGHHLILAYEDANPPTITQFFADNRFGICQSSWTFIDKRLDACN